MSTTLESHSKKSKVVDAPSPVTKRILILFKSFGKSDYIGEAISILDHSLQAAKLAKDMYPNDEEFILANLFHDIGHILGLEAGEPMKMEGCGIVDHEIIGANYVKSLGFSERIQKLIRHHVSAKRYLCFADSSYYNNLSDASKTTLKYQGGPMSETEAAAFKADPDFEHSLRMRTIDENAKKLDVDAPPLEDYISVINRLTTSKSTSYQLSEVQLDFWKRNSYLKVSNLLAYEGITPENVVSWVDEISSWAPAEKKWLQHWELSSDNTKILCRSENFVNYHPPMKDLCCSSVLSVVSQLFGEEAVLFKEKINYKLPGGSGFAAHQDTPAYIGLAEDHVSVMVAVDRSTLENGCLHVAPGVYKKDQIKLNERGILTPEEDAKLKYIPVECAPGDIVFFTGYIPHRSEANKSANGRRAAFLTYNPLSQGNYHEEYYRAKHEGVKGFNGAHALSFQGDFMGKIVD